MNSRKQIVSWEEIRKTALRIEKNPSFKINCNKTYGYNFGIGKGGNIIDFAILYHECTVRDF
jgi:hypothetical protein